MKISILQLRAICDLLCSCLEKNRQDIAQLSTEYYWEIPMEYRYDPYQDPKGFTLGKLSDDWAELEKLLGGEYEPFELHLIPLSKIILALGEEQLLNGGVH